MEKFIKLALGIGLGIVLPTFLAALQFPAFAKWIKIPENVDTLPDLAIIIGIIIAVFAVSIWSFVITIYSPEKKYERAKNVRAQYLRGVAQKIIDDLKQKGFEVTFNVMVLKRVWYARLAPINRKTKKGRLHIFPRVLKCDWTSDKSYIGETLGIEQGTSGKAFKAKKGDPVYKNVERITKYKHAYNRMNLNKKQYKNLKGVTFLISTPIKAQKSLNSRVEKTIGVLTMECSQKGAGIMADKPNKFDAQPVIKNKIIENQTVFQNALKGLSDAYASSYF